MKVSFKLNKNQLSRAKAIVAWVQREWETTDPECRDEKHTVWCGNLIGNWGHGFNFNPNQNLELLDNGVVQYQGQRCPLVQDMGLLTLARIAGFTDEYPWREDFSSPLVKKWYEGRDKAVKTLVVKNYETSDPDLAWWETAEDKAHRLVREGKVTSAIVAKAVADAENGLWLTNAERAYLSVLDGVKPAEPGSPAYKRAAAEGSQEWAALAYRYQKAKGG